MARVDDAAVDSAAMLEGYLYVRNRLPEEERDLLELSEVTFLLSSHPAITSFGYLMRRCARGCKIVPTEQGYVLFFLHFFAA